MLHFLARVECPLVGLGRNIGKQVHALFRWYMEYRLLVSYLCGRRYSEGRN